MTLTLTRSEKIFGGVYLLLQTLLVPFAVTALCMALGNPSDALINLICFFCNALLALVFFRRLLVRSWRNAARDWKRTLAVTAKGFGLYWAINLLITAGQETKVEHTDTDLFRNVIHYVGMRIKNQRIVFGCILCL